MKNLMISRRGAETKKIENFSSNVKTITIRYFASSDLEYLFFLEKTFLFLASENCKKNFVISVRRFETNGSKFFFEILVNYVSAISRKKRKQHHY